MARAGQATAWAACYAYDYIYSTQTFSTLLGTGGVKNTPYLLQPLQPTSTVASPWSDSALTLRNLLGTVMTYIAPSIIMMSADNYVVNCQCVHVRGSLSVSLPHSSTDSVNILSMNWGSRATGTPSPVCPILVSHNIIVLALARLPCPLKYCLSKIETTIN